MRKWINMRPSPNLQIPFDDNVTKDTIRDIRDNVRNEIRSGMHAFRKRIYNHYYGKIKALLHMGSHLSAFAILDAIQYAYKEADVDLGDVHEALIKTIRNEFPNLNISELERGYMIRHSDEMKRK